MEKIINKELRKYCDELLQKINEINTKNNTYIVSKPHICIYEKDTISVEWEEDEFTLILNFSEDTDDILVYYKQKNEKAYAKHIERDKILKHVEKIFKREI